MYKIRTDGEIKKMSQQSLNSDGMYMMRTVHLKKSVKLYAISSEILQSIDFWNIFTKVKLQKHILPYVWTFITVFINLLLLAKHE